MTNQRSPQFLCPSPYQRSRVFYKIYTELNSSKLKSNFYESSLKLTLLVDLA